VDFSARGVGIIFCVTIYVVVGFAMRMLVKLFDGLAQHLLTRKRPAVMGTNARQRQAMRVGVIGYVRD